MDQFLGSTSLPLAVIIFLLFAPFEFSSNTLATVYYLVIATLFWTLYTTYVIPYMGLGAEITTDYKGRNYVRIFNMIFGGLFMLMCTSGPMQVWSWGIEKGLSDRTAWGISGAIFGLIALVCGVISWAALKGKETPYDEKAFQKQEHESIFHVIKETMQIKPYRKLCSATFFFFIGQIASGVALVYLLSYNCGMSESQQSLFWLIYAVAYTVMVPVGGALTNKFGKKKAFIMGQTITTILCVLFFFIKIDSFMDSVIYVTIFQFGATLFWTTYLAFAYDCAEVDEYKNGKRREGSLCAVVSFAQKFGSAIGTYTVGSMLTFVGYDAMVESQTEAALNGILGLCTLLPAFGAVIAILFMLKYPIGPKEYDLIVEAVKDRKAGREVDESGFRHCL